MTDAERKADKVQHFCPYCDDEIAESSWPYCDSCKVDFFHCPKCRQAVPTDKKVCPHCGAEIKG